MYDVGVIGAGIVGLATAWRLLQREPSLRLVVLEKEGAVARHQSGRNSGVIHSGIYYAPGSQKAQTCVTGRAALLAYCTSREIPVRRLGKVIVATTETQARRIDELLARGEANGVECRALDAEELTRIEPRVRGVVAVLVPDASVVDFRRVCEALRDDVESVGGTVRTASEVVSIARDDACVSVGLRTDVVACRHAVNCGGLQSDRIARMAGARPSLRIVPFRGEFFAVRDPLASEIRGLVYPVPDPALPFLGVHFTPTVHDTVECGPNAVLALGREAYGRSLPDVGEVLRNALWPAFWRLGWRYARAAAAESWRSWNRAAFVAALRVLVPSLTRADLGARRTGIRAQAVGNDGRLLDDFCIEDTPGMTHVLNAPSPAATAALAIGNDIADRVLTHL